MSATQERFIKKLEETFSSQSTGAACTFAIAEFVVEVTGPDTLLHMLTPALAHLETANRGQIDLRIELHTGPLPLFERWVADTFGKQVLRLSVLGYHCLYNPGIEVSSPYLYFLDLTNRRAIYWILDESQLPWYEVATPFRTIFYWFFSAQKLLLLHSAAIGRDGKGVVLVGKGGSGKTTTALQVLEQPGLQYAGDDYVVAKLGKSTDLFSLYCTAKVEKQPVPSALEKDVLFPFRTHPERIVNHLVAQAIVIPRITQTSTTTWRRVPRSQALLALAPSTIFQLQPENPFHNSFADLATLAQAMPAYVLELGRDIQEVGGALVTFFEAVL